jgi:hypothetical protein
MAGPSQFPKILFVSHAPDHKNLEQGLDFFEMTFWGPLRETGLTEFDTFWFKPWLVDSIADMDWQLYEKCVEYRPDVLFVYGWWQHFEDVEARWKTSLVAIYLIRRLLNIKVVALYIDHSPEDTSGNLDNLTRFCDLAFTHEYEHNFLPTSKFPQKYRIMQTVISPKLYHKEPQNQRDIGLTFLGKTGGYVGNRSAGLVELRRRGLEVLTGGGIDQQGRITKEEYASYLHRSKIVINWSLHTTGRWYQAKGRIFETTLSGAMLLCEECDAVNRWLRPFVDYVPFSNAQELADRAEYYLENEAERLKIAQQGYETAMAKYSATEAWADTLRKIQGSELYREDEALEGLRRNASFREVEAVVKFSAELDATLSGTDRVILHEAVANVRKGYSIAFGRMHWQSWHSRKKRWQLGQFWRKINNEKDILYRELGKLKRKWN